MAAEEFATALERLIAQARADGLTDEAIIAGLEEAIDTIEDGLAGSLESAASSSPEAPSPLSQPGCEARGGRAADGGVSITVPPATISQTRQICDRR